MILHCKYKTKKCSVSAQQIIFSKKEKNFYQKKRVIILKREKRGDWLGIALCNDEKGDNNGIVSLLLELMYIIYSNSIRYLWKKKEKS